MRVRQKTWLLPGLLPLVALAVLLALCGGTLVIFLTFPLVALVVGLPFPLVAICSFLLSLHGEAPKVDVGRG